MSGQPLLSVLLTTHIEPESFESLLDALLGFGLSQCEFVVVIDVAGTAQAETIRQLQDTYPKSRIACLKYEQPRGRAHSLNAGLQHAKGSLIWAPMKAKRLNKTLLKESIRKMISDPAAFWVLDRYLPADLQGWLKEIEEGTLPQDNRFVFNRATLPADQLFFRDGLDCFTAAELAFRVKNRKSHHKTDSFFVVDTTSGPKPTPQVMQEFFFSMLREYVQPEQRIMLVERVKKLDFTPKNETDELSALEKVHGLAEQDSRLALDQVNNYLKEYPDHQEACRLKISLLEKLRRHVEAAELKHELQKKSARTGPFVSIVIPTTGNGKSILQECLIHLDKICDPSSTELIVVDNASIDDTFDYLGQLEEQNFLNIRVITNSVNRGFGASVNQGIDAANGKYLLVMHNDLFPEEGSIEIMVSLLDANPQIGVAGPVVDRCDLEFQLSENVSGTETGFINVRQIDSCCMLLRLSTGVRFNETYGLAYYEDADLCNKITDLGFYVAIATNARAAHQHRVTTNAMGLNLEPEQRWMNADIYNVRWNESPELKIPQEGPVTEVLNKIPLPVNPQNPSGHWLHQIDLLFSDEVKTEIHNSTLLSKDLFNLIRILLIADKRDFLRQNESQLESVNIPPDLLTALIRYYYRRNIYSRCRLYLKRPEAKGPLFDLYKLRILVAEKETEQSVELLTNLMKKFPCHPDLYRIAGDIHRMDDNEGEAKSFYALAGQLNPKYTVTDEETFEIKY